MLSEYAQPMVSLFGRRKSFGDFLGILRNQITVSNCRMRNKLVLNYYSIRMLGKSKGHQKSIVQEASSKRCVKNKTSPTRKRSGFYFYFIPNLLSRFLSESLNGSFFFCSFLDFGFASESFFIDNDIFFFCKSTPITFT